MKKRKLKRIEKTDLENILVNEQDMKRRGEIKVRKDIVTKNGKLKKIANTQRGQKIILDEALRVLPQVFDWIQNKSHSTYKNDLKEYFVDEDFTLQKLVEVYLYMAGSIYSKDGIKSEVAKTRHKKVNSIKERIMPELNFNNVWRFIEVAISYSEYFDTKSEHKYKGGNFSKSVRYTCSIEEKLLNEINLIAVNAFYPLPMERPPIDWELKEDGIVGGYETYQYEMIRSTSGKIDYTKFSKDVFESINYIQSVPWKVNEKVLDQLILDLTPPKKEDFVKSDYPNMDLPRWDVDLKDENAKISNKEREEILKQREAFKEKSNLYNAELSDYESALGKFRYATLATQIAKKYVGKIIYFPHNFDFRGRIYPLPIGLSPQGSDAIKALLLYVNEESLTKSGLQWCWAYLASLWGDDKLPFNERVERGKELINANYKEADEPYQFLSHQIELQKHTQDPSYRPNVRIHLDACNSGSQFTSAITGDLAGCKATNVIPSIKPDGKQDRQDAYILVANKSIELAQSMFDQSDDKDEKNTIGFLQSLLEDDGRKICKVPVMVSNYGGTSGGRSEILWHMLRELEVDRKWITKRVASLFSRIIGDSIVGVLNGGKAFESYIHKMNNVIAKHNEPITWKTSDGFHVVHSKNKELKPKIVRCLIPGARRSSTITKKSYSKNLSCVKMKSAISPNYIHSLDAELLRTVALRMKSIGVMDTDWIHDSFGAHPNHIDKLLEITKEVFLKLMENKPLELLDSQLRSQVPNDKKSQKELDLIKIPMLGNFDDENNLKKVLQSNWFFS